MSPSTILVSAFIALAAARPFKFPDGEVFPSVDTIDMR
jgi:hypothetical protein